MVFGFHWPYPFPRFSRTGGSGLLTASRFNDFELYRPTRRAGLGRLHKRALLDLNDDSSILVSPGQACGGTQINLIQSVISSHPYDLVIGMDRSDHKADLHLVDIYTGQRRSETIDTAPEALCEWLLQFRQHHPQGRVALCLEQPRRPSARLPGSLPADRSLPHQPRHPAEISLGLRNQPRQGRCQGCPIPGRAAPESSRAAQNPGPWES